MLLELIQTPNMLSLCESDCLRDAAWRSVTQRDADLPISQNKDGILPVATLSIAL